MDDWKIIVAIGAAAILQSIAYAIREWANGKARARMETKIDGNTALTATQLVSSGNLPRAAPCIPAVAKAVSQQAQGCTDAVKYATTATDVAHDTMQRENIPVQSQELLVKKLHTMITETSDQAEETRVKEERHAARSVEQIKVLRDEIERLKAKIEAEKNLQNGEPG